MTAPVCRVPSCDRPVGDGYVCQRCARQLEAALGDIPAITHQLDITLTKGGRFADRNERVGAETPLPLDPRASQAAGTLRHHLTNWVTIVADKRGLPLPAAAIYGAEPAPGILASWLLRHTEWLRHYEHGHVAVDELVGDVDHARTVIDVPANRTTFPVGPCPEIVVVMEAHSCMTHAGGYAYPELRNFCPGEVRAYIPNNPDKPCRLECNTCHTTWGTVQWHRTGRRILERKAQTEGAA